MEAVFRPSPPSPPRRSDKTRRAIDAFGRLKDPMTLFVLLSIIIHLIIATILVQYQVEKLEEDSSEFPVYIIPREAIAPFAPPVVAQRRIDRAPLLKTPAPVQVLPKGGPPSGVESGETFRPSRSPAPVSIPKASKTVPVAPESLTPESPAIQKPLVPDAVGAGRGAEAPEKPTAGLPDSAAPLPGSREGTTKPPPKVALYDPAVVREYSRTPIPESKDASKRPLDITLDTADLKHLSYIYRLKDRIESIVFTPERPVPMYGGIAGSMLVRFVINKDGSLKELVALRTSGNSFLDEAALKAFRSAFPFQPLPEKWHEDELPIMTWVIITRVGMSMR